MKSLRRVAFEEEIRRARELLDRGMFREAFVCLERAHVLGQQDIWPHVLSHWLMLKLAWRNGDARGVLGQALRIMLGAIGSAIGIVPTGNTGGTNVNMFRRMPIDPALQKLMQD